MFQQVNRTDSLSSVHFLAPVGGQVSKESFLTQHSPSLGDKQNVSSRFNYDNNNDEDDDQTEFERKKKKGMHEFFIWKYISLTRKIKY